MVDMLKPGVTAEDDFIFQIVHAKPVDLIPLQEMCLYAPELVTLSNCSVLVKLLV